MGAKAKQDDRAGEKSQYQCPVYKYPKRNDKYLIFRVGLKCDAQGGNNNLSRGVTPAMNWKLKGAALLCSKE
jgi:dynein heavy chain